MAKIHGKDFGVYVDDVLIGDSKDCTLNVNQAMVAVTSKDDANWADNLAGMRDWSVDVSYIQDSANAVDGVDLLDLILGAAEVQIVFSKTSGSTEYWYGQAFASSSSIAAPLEGGVGGSINFVGKGILNKASIAYS